MFRGNKSGSYKEIDKDISLQEKWDAKLDKTHMDRMPSLYHASYIERYKLVRQFFCFFWILNVLFKIFNFFLVILEFSWAGWE